MPVYWSIYIISLLAYLLPSYQNRYYQLYDGTNVRQPAAWCMYLPILTLLFFVGLRDEVLDTHAYIGSFCETPTDIAGITTYALQSPTGRLFYFVQGLFKAFISENYYAWLSFLGGVSLFCLFKQYKKHSPDYLFTFFLFISSTSFTWLINGSRQFVVACILFALSDWIVSKDRKYTIWYLCLILILYYAHSSCLFLLPLVYICSRGGMLNKRMFLLVVATMIATYFSDSIMGGASELMGKEYDINEGRGSSVPRLFVSLVPVALTIFKWSEVKAKATPFMQFAINMSLVGACFFYASTFTNGILIGRMPIYFTLYNYILLPWLIKNFYSQGIVQIVCVVFYTIFFYFQMIIAWHGLTYVSEILNIYYRSHAY